MKKWTLVVIAQSIATSVHAESINTNVASIGDEFFMRKEAVDLLFSDYGDLFRSFSCTSGKGFVVEGAGYFNGICIVDKEVYSIEAITWHQSSELQAVTVCNHAVVDTNHSIPVDFLRQNELESTDWTLNDRVIGKVRYLGRTGGWFSDEYDNILLDGAPLETQALCWRVKKPRK